MFECGIKEGSIPKRCREVRVNESCSSCIEYGLMEALIKTVFLWLVGSNCVCVPGNECLLQSRECVRMYIQNIIFGQYERPHSGNRTLGIQRS